MRYRTSIIHSGAISCALVLFLLAPVNGIAQSEKAEPRQNKQDTTSHRMTPLAEMLATGEAKPPFGWLILDGELIPGPYEVVIGDSSVTVNGLPVIYRPPRKEVPNVNPDQTAQLVRHYLMDTLVQNFRRWYREQGVDSAHQRTLEFLQKRTIVDTARFHGNLLLELQFIVEGKHAEEWLEFKPGQDQPQKTGRGLRGRLEFVGRRIEAHLSSGHLVLSQEGRYNSDIPYPESRRVIEEIEQIAETIPDLEGRVAAISKVIPGKKAARAIAERFLR